MSSSFTVYGGQRRSLYCDALCCEYAVNSCAAGNGHLAAKVKAPTTQPPVMITDSSGLAALSFVPLETGEHLFFVTYDDINIPGE